MAVSKKIRDVYAAVQKDLDVNIHQVPQVDKVIVAIGIGSLVTRKNLKDLSEIESNLTAITGRKPHIIKSKKSVSNFKLREGMPVMMKVTLRDQAAYDFLFKLMSIVLPRVRDFEGLSPESFDQSGNYSFGLPNYSLFPELHPDDVTIPVGIQITIGMTQSNIPASQKVLEGL